MIKIKDGEVRPEGCICELNFGYNAKTKTVVYTNSSSDIPELYAIDFGTPVIEKLKKKINNV